MKPMDLQTLLPRSTDVARAKQVEISRPAVAQQQFAAEVHRQAAQKQRTVSEPPRVRGGRVQRDGGKGNRGHTSGGGPKGGGDRRGPGQTGDGGSLPDGAGAGKGRLVNVVLDLGQG